jgi:phosphoribosylformylglycinamidine (FGAM) synthase-like amidotransferase family enzyme
LNHQKSPFFEKNDYFCVQIQKKMAQITDFSQLDLKGTYSYADYLSWKFEQALELIKGKILKMAVPSRVENNIF